MKKYIKNVVLVMSGGSGTRFGADKPKQYCICLRKGFFDEEVRLCR